MKTRCQTPYILGKSVTSEMWYANVHPSMAPSPNHIPCTTLSPFHHTLVDSISRTPLVPSDLSALANPHAKEKHLQTFLALPAQSMHSCIQSGIDIPFPSLTIELESLKRFESTKSIHRGGTMKTRYALHANDVAFASMHGTSDAKGMGGKTCGRSQWCWARAIAARMEEHNNRNIEIGCNILLGTRRVPSHVLVERCTPPNDALAITSVPSEQQPMRRRFGTHRRRSHSYETPAAIH